MDVACTWLIRLNDSMLTMFPPECQGVGHGWFSALTSNAASLKVILTCPQLQFPANYLLRDPSQHSSLQAEIENQSTALYSTARLWDDGIIKPTDTRDVVGLGLALAARDRGSEYGQSGSSSTTWDGDGKGFGVFRM